jgi:hypothetical protein
MKKVSVIAAAALALLSCKKEMENHITTPTVPYGYSTTSLLEYEYYTPDGDVETEIREALVALEDDGSLGYTSINRGVWVLETGISYLIPDSDYEYVDFDSDTSTYIVSLNEQGEASEADLKAALIELHGAIMSWTNDSVKHVATDIKVLEVSSDAITLGAITTYLTGVDQAGAINCNTVQGPPYNGITADYLAGIRAYCTGGPAFTSGLTEAANPVKQSLRCLTASSNRFYTHTLSYSSVGLGNNIAVSSSNLLGHANAPFSYHQTWAPITLCVIASEWNTYSQVINDDIRYLMGKDKNFIELNMQINYSSINSTDHCQYEYRSISLGTSYHTQNTTPLTLSYI